MLLVSVIERILQYTGSNAQFLFNTTAYVKAAARDIKAYLTSKGSTALVGYASVDGDEDFRGNSFFDFFTPGSRV